MAALAPLFLTACKTNSQTDWNSRIGNYTYDQALAELGKPQTTQMLPDGTRTAEWLVREGRPTSVEYGMNPGFVTPGIRESQIPYETTQMPAQFLRLTFAPDGRLKAWRQSAR